MKFCINGRRFRLKTAPCLRDEADARLYGEVRHDKRQIVLDVSVHEKERLDTLLHEFFHAFFDYRAGRMPLFDEATVEQFGTDAANFLWALGYRCPQDKDYGEVTK